MSKRSSFTYILLFALVVFSSAPAAEAEIRRATVAVDGLACPFCAFGLEKRLKKVGGVESAAVQTREGTATLTARDGESIDVGQIPAAVERAGFTPGGVTIDAVGRVARDEQDRVILEVSGSDQMFLLGSFDAEMEERLGELAGRGAFASVTGPLHAHRDDLSAITPETIEDVPR